MSRNAGAPRSALWARPCLCLAAAVLFVPIGTILEDFGLFHGLAVLAALAGLWTAVVRR